MGSFFGYGTFKQRLLQHIIDEAKSEHIDLLQAASDTMEVVGHLSCIAFRRDDELAAIYERAKEDAKRELLAKMNG